MKYSALLMRKFKKTREEKETDSCNLFKHNQLWVLGDKKYITMRREVLLIVTSVKFTKPFKRGK